MREHEGGSPCPSCGGEYFELLHEIQHHPTCEVHGPRYPEITVTLVGQDANAFSILGKVRAALKRAGLSSEEVEAFTIEACSGDYDHLLATVMRWVDVQ
jgi:hypothetical protein